MADISVKNGFQCGGHWWDVLSDDETRQELQSRVQYGYCSYPRKLVRVDPTPLPCQVSHTVTHEITHVVDDTYLNQLLTEDQVTVFANGLHQVLESLGVRFVL